MLPPLSDEEKDLLKEGIRKNGQIVPIVVYKEQIIDGRHRFWACKQLGIEPKIMTLDVEMDARQLIEYAFSINIQRRNLSKSQLAAMAANSTDLFTEDAKQRMLAGKPLDPTAKMQEGLESTEKAAKLFGVSGRYVAYAEAIKKFDAGLFNMLLGGDISITEAAKAMKKRMDSSEVGDVSADDDKPMRVGNPPIKWEADCKYEITMGGEPCASVFFNSDTMKWDAQYYEV